MLGLTIHKMKDLIQPGEIEISDERHEIEPNTKVIVRRLPHKEVEPIEFDYCLDVSTTDLDIRMPSARQMIIQLHSMMTDKEAQNATARRNGLFPQQQVSQTNNQASAVKDGADGQVENN